LWKNHIGQEQLGESFEMFEDNHKVFLGKVRKRKGRQIFFSSSST
jgi:hypothetical protein